jgi:hypothetical protein
MRLRLQEEQLEQLCKLFNAEKGSKYQWLGYNLNFENGNIQDQLDPDMHHTESEIHILTVLLAHYLQAKPTPRTGKLIKFKDLQGGYAYERAFLQRAVQPIAQTFGENPAELVEAGKLLNGKSLSLGNASVEIPALEGIPLTYIVWAKGEFPATANILYDETAGHYLPTEDLAILAEITTSRLIKAKTAAKNKAEQQAKKKS